MPRKTIYAAALMVLSLSVPLIACAPTLATRGNFVDDDRLKGIQLHVSTKDEVESKLGTPTTVDPFDDNKWFYIGEKTSTEAFFDPKVLSRKVLGLTFSKEGLLENVENVDAKAGKNVEIVTKKTPAPGRDMSTVEQFFSNIGKFNSVGAQQQGPGRDGN
jgi:outer membrane protein assembly factor BamE (lipoprotein component of BamABCDE complex)